MNLKPGDHLCCIYETEAEHTALIKPFVREGLERGERVIYVVDTHDAATILGALRDDGIAVDPCLETGRLQILPSDIYLDKGVFDPDSMIALLRTETRRALALGYSALRVTGEMTWVLRGAPGSERIIEYEAKLNEFFPGSRCLAICQYDRRRFDPAVLLDVLRTHPIAVIGTEIYRNFYYIPPAEFLGGDGAAAKLDRWVENLVDLKLGDEALREARRTLERRIQARTVALTKANEELNSEIVERKRVEAELLDSQRKLSDQTVLLEHKNIALTELIGRLRDEKDRIEDLVRTNVDQILLPLLTKFRHP